MEDLLIIRSVINHKEYLVEKEFLALNFINGVLEESDTCEEDDWSDCKEYAVPRKTN